MEETKCDICDEACYVHYTDLRGVLRCFACFHRIVDANEGAVIRALRAELKATKALLDREFP